MAPLYIAATIRWCYQRIPLSHTGASSLSVLHILISLTGMLLSSVHVHTLTRVVQALSLAVFKHFSHSSFLEACILSFNLLCSRSRQATSLSSAVNTTRLFLALWNIFWNYTVYRTMLFLFVLQVSPSITYTVRKRIYCSTLNYIARCLTKLIALLILTILI